MANVTYRPATVADVEDLLPRLRQADINECEALFGDGSLRAAAFGTLLGAVMAWAAEVDGKVEAIFGVSGRFLDNVGHPWMFGSNKVDRHSRTLIRDGGGYIRSMMELFPRLENVVDARNTKSIRWLKRVGFTIRPAVTMGAAGFPFHPFDMGV